MNDAIKRVKGTLVITPESKKKSFSSTGGLCTAIETLSSWILLIAYLTYVFFIINKFMIFNF